VQEYASSVLYTENSSSTDPPDGGGGGKQVRTDPTLPWFESRRHTCRICDGVFLFSQIYDHLRWAEFLAKRYNDSVKNATMIFAKM
jgi:hypothetical protein